MSAEVRGVDALSYGSSSLKSYVYKCMNSLNETETFLLFLILTFIGILPFLLDLFSR